PPRCGGIIVAIVLARGDPQPPECMQTAREAPSESNPPNAAIPGNRDARAEQILRRRPGPARRGPGGAPRGNLRGPWPQRAVQDPPPPVAGPPCPAPAPAVGGCPPGPGGRSRWRCGPASATCPASCASTTT